MQHLISFTTSKFDVRQEDKNPINPIYGQSLLLWLRDILKGEIEITEPDYEDWGWYCDIDWHGRNYMLGASSEVDIGQFSSLDEPPKGVYWMFQIDKQRSLLEKILGKEKMTPDDECLKFFKSLFDAQPEFHNVQIE